MNNKTYVFGRWWIDVMGNVGLAVICWFGDMKFSHFASGYCAMYAITLIINHFAHRKLDKQLNKEIQQIDHLIKVVLSSPPVGSIEAMKN